MSQPFPLAERRFHCHEAAVLRDLRGLLRRMRNRIVDARNPASSVAEAAVALEGLHLLIDSACEVMRARPGRVGCLDAAQWLGAAEPALRSTLSEQVRLVVELPLPGEIFVRGTSVALQRVLTELAANAQAAMPRGGLLRVGICPAEELASGLVPAPLPAGAYARLFVEDSGAGIDPGHLRNIFAPGFSTKGRGRGHGLSIVSDVLQGLGGGIRVVSGPGRGCRFDVFLPLAGD